MVGCRREEMRRFGSTFKGWKDDYEEERKIKRESSP
jgi:hypothetical protein